MPQPADEPAPPLRSLTRYYVVIGALVGLDLLEAVVHLVYGRGCWGLQPGGKSSMHIAEGLAVTFVIAAAMSLTSAGGGLLLAKRLTGAVLGLGIIIATYVLRGWTMFTSLHNQGPENLLMLGALNAGIVCVLLTGLGKEAGK